MSARHGLSGMRTGTGTGSGPGTGSGLGTGTGTGRRAAEGQRPARAHLLQLLHRERAGYVLLVGKDEQRGAYEPLLLQQRLQLLPAR